MVERGREETEGEYDKRADEKKTDTLEERWGLSNVKHCSLSMSTQSYSLCFHFRFARCI